MSKRHAVSDVFTPRKNEVNREIYVDRDDLEKELRRALSGSLNPIVFGESGSGKSWLYKKVLTDMHASVFIANCANATALRLGSLTEEIHGLVVEHEPKQMTELSEEMNAGLDGVFLKGGLKSTRKYAYGEHDPVLDCFRLLRKRAGTAPAVLVIDNLEMIFNSPERMEELASIITLLDDGRYAEYNVKLLVVGVPSEIRTYLYSTNESVGNRTIEISEISSLTRGQVDSLTEKGFVELLQVYFPDGLLRTWQDHIYYVTMGYAQPVQEYCEQLGYLLEDANWVATEAHLAEADAAWFRQGFSKAMEVILSVMNVRETKTGRRNQVLFSLGKIPGRVFHASDVETILRREFADTTPADVTLAVGQLLSELASNENPIIKQRSKSTMYEFKDARYAMALRILLLKDTLRGKVGVAIS